MNTYADFMKGRFSGVSLTRDGRIVLAPRLQPVFSSDEPTIWSVSQAPDGSIYVGTGHRGRLYRVEQERRKYVGLDRARAGDICSNCRGGWDGLRRYVAWRQGIQDPERRSRTILHARTPNTSGPSRPRATAFSMWAPVITVECIA